MVPDIAIRQPVIDKRAAAGRAFLKSPAGELPQLFLPAGNLACAIGFNPPGLALVAAMTEGCDYKLGDIPKIGYTFEPALEEIIQARQSEHPDTVHRQPGPYGTIITFKKAPIPVI